MKIKTQTERPQQNRKGFTLLEVLLVLGILVVIAAMVVPQMLGRQKEAYVNAAKVSISNFEESIRHYAQAHDGEYPEGDAETVTALLMSDVDSEGEKQNVYLEKRPLDPWSQPLQYEYPASGNRKTVGGKPAIWSFGPDKRDGTEDDITNWEEDAK